MNVPGKYLNSQLPFTKWLCRSRCALYRSQWLSKVMFNYSTVYFTVTTNTKGYSASQSNYFNVLKSPLLTYNYQLKLASTDALNNLKFSSTLLCQSVKGYLQSKPTLNHKTFCVPVTRGYCRLSLGAFWTAKVEVLFFTVQFYNSFKCKLQCCHYICMKSLSWFRESL